MTAWTWASLRLLFTARSMTLPAIARPHGRFQGVVRLFDAALQPGAKTHRQAIEAIFTLPVGVLIAAQLPDTPMNLLPYGGRRFFKVHAAGGL